MAGVKDQNLQPMGYQQLTVSTVAVVLTVPLGARYALFRIAVAANSVRYRDDAVAPTAAIGFPVDSTTPFWYTGILKKLQFIRAAAADAVLEVLYYA